MKGFDVPSLLLRSICLVVATGLTIGCGYSRPALQPPGPIYQQQQNASLHDPYSDNDLGPEVVGGRPRDFQKPMAEPVRNRTWSESWFGFGR